MCVSQRGWEGAAVCQGHCGGGDSDFFPPRRNRPSSVGWERGVNILWGSKSTSQYNLYSLTTSEGIGVEVAQYRYIILSLDRLPFFVSPSRRQILFESEVGLVRSTLAGIE